MHGSNQATPMSSDVEMLPDMTTRHDQQTRPPVSGSEVRPPVSAPEVYSPYTPQGTLQAQHGTLLYQNSKSLQQLQAERDPQSAAKSSILASNSPLTSTNNVVTPNSGLTNSGCKSNNPLLQQLQDLSSSLQKDMEKPSKKDQVAATTLSLSNLTDFDPTEKSSAASKNQFGRNIETSVAGKKLSDIVTNTGFTSPVAFQERSCDKYVKNSLPPPLMPSPRAPMEEETVTPRFSESIRKKTIENQESDVSKSAELSAAGFVTLKSLMDSANSDIRDKIDSQMEVLRTEPEKTVIKSPGASTNVSGSMFKSPQSDGTGSGSESGGRKVNMQYMGSIPTSMDYTSFFKTMQQHGSCLVVDGRSTQDSKDVLQKLESLMAAGQGKKGVEPQASTSKGQGKGKKVKGLKLKATEQGSGSESMNSNCSLGTKISRQAKKGKASPKKEKTVIIKF